MSKKRILLICNDSDTVINFRKELILFLQKNDYDVSVIVSDDRRNEDILKLNVLLKVVPFNNRSKNPFSYLSLKRHFAKEIRKINPDIVFTFQIKPNTAGVIASKKAGISNVFSMIEGLGDPFQPKSFKGKILKIIVSHLYRKSLNITKKVFFLNEDDRREFVENKIIPLDKCVLIPGIGIDTSKYMFKEELSKNKRVLVLSRLLKNKGIFDCCEVAKKVKETRPDIEFSFFGKEGDIKVSDLSEYIDSKIITFNGYTKDAMKEIADCRILLSCSYREGFPRIFLESMAIGRVVLSSDVIGSRAVIENGVTGYLVPVHDVSSFASKIIELIDDDSTLKKVARQARTICENKYSSNSVNKLLLEEITK